MNNGNSVTLSLDEFLSLRDTTMILKSFVDMFLNGCEIDPNSGMLCFNTNKKGNEILDYLANYLQVNLSDLVSEKFNLTETSEEKGEVEKEN